MGKWWSVLFAVMMTLAAGLFVAAPFVNGWWLPEPLSTHAHRVDGLFYDILWVTTFFFILTEALLCWFMWKFAQRQKAAAAAPAETAVTAATPPGPGAMARLLAPARKLFADQHKLEIAWTIVPAVILLYIAFAQVSTWADVKYLSRGPNAEYLKKKPEDRTGDDMPLQTAITARQWDWSMRYPGVKTWQAMKAKPARDNDSTAGELLAKAWSKGRQIDDLIVPNELHVIVDRPVVIYLSTADVLHSLFLPQMRVKQDSLPGKIIPVWFTPIASNTSRLRDANGKELDVWQDGGGLYERTGRPKDPSLVWEISCAELCGSRHGFMKGKLFVHPSEADFLQWLQVEETKQRSRGEVKAAASN